MFFFESWFDSFDTRWSPKQIGRKIAKKGGISWQRSPIYRRKVTFCREDREMWRDGSITRLDVLPHLVDRHQRLISSQPIYWWSPDWSLLPLCFAERHLWHNHPSYLDILFQLKLTNGRILFFELYSQTGWLFLNWKTFEASIRIGPYYKMYLCQSQFFSAFYFCSISSNQIWQ